MQFSHTFYEISIRREDELALQKIFIKTLTFSKNTIKY